MAQLTHELETFDVATPELSSSPPIYLIPPFPSISPPAPTFHISTPPPHISIPLSLPSHIYTPKLPYLSTSPFNLSSLHPYI